MRYWRPELLIRSAFIPAASATFSGLVSTWQSSISRPEPVSRTNIEYRFLMTAVPFQARPRPRCRRQDGKNTCCAISYRDRAEACNLRRDWINKGVGDVFISQARAQAPRGLWFLGRHLFRLGTLEGFLQSVGDLCTHRSNCFLSCRSYLLTQRCVAACPKFHGLHHFLKHKKTSHCSLPQCEV